MENTVEQVELTKSGSQAETSIGSQKKKPCH